MRIGYKSVLSYDGVRSSWSDPALLTSPWVMESLCSLLCGTAGILKTLRVHCLTLLSRFKIYFISDTDGDPRQNLGLESPHRSAWEQSLVCLINGVCVPLKGIFLRTCLWWSRSPSSNNRHVTTDCVTHSWLFMWVRLTNSGACCAVLPPVQGSTDTALAPRNQAL